MTHVDLVRAHLLARLCELQLQDEFGDGLMEPEERESLISLRKTAELLLPMFAHPPGRHWRPSPQGKSQSPSRPTVFDVFHRALECDSCPSVHCPVAGHAQRQKQKLH